MRRPRKALSGLRSLRAAAIAPSEVQRILNYVAYLEDRAATAEGYAAKKDQMYQDLEDRFLTLKARIES